MKIGIIKSFKEFVNRRDKRFFSAVRICILTFLALQLVFWYKTENVKPNLGILPPVPSENRIKLGSLGDSQFYFRMKAFRLQNAGDTFGRVTAFKDYDYAKLYRWLKILDILDSKSNFTPYLAGYYYSNSQDKEDAYYMVRYLEEHFDTDPDEKWWWLYQAYNITDKVIGDKEEALRIAWRLHDDTTDSAPIWTKQMVAFAYEGGDNACASYAVINQIMQDIQSGKMTAKDRELEFMASFIEERLPKVQKKLNEGTFNPQQCKSVNIESLRGKKLKNKTLEKTAEAN